MAIPIQDIGSCKKRQVKTFGEPSLKEGTQDAPTIDFEERTRLSNS